MDIQDTKEFAQRVTEYRNLQLGEMLKAIGYQTSEITRDTYLYIDMDGRLCGIEKTDVESRPADLFESIGYIRAWDGGVAYARADLGDVLTAGEATEIYGLASATVRQAINRGNIPARKSGGTWLIRRTDAEALWGNIPGGDLGGMAQCPRCGSEDATQFQPGRWQCYSCGSQFSD